MDVRFDFCGVNLLRSEGTRPRSVGGQERSVPVESATANRGATLPVTARPPKYPETHSHKYVNASLVIMEWCMVL